MDIIRWSILKSDWLYYLQPKIEKLYTVTLCTPGPRRKEQGPHKRLTQTCPWVSRSLRWRHGSTVACCKVRDTDRGMACMGPCEGGHHYLHYLHHSLTSGQTTGREHSPTHQQKTGLKIYWARPHPSEPVSPPLVSPIKISLSPSLSITGQTEWKPQSQKTNQIDHMDHSLV